MSSHENASLTSLPSGVDHLAAQASQAKLAPKPSSSLSPLRWRPIGRDAFPEDKRYLPRETSLMTIENTGPEPLIFKVKTTHPDSFRVQPKDGRLEPGETQEITISPTPESSKPKPSQFRCVYVVSPPSEITSVSDYITSKESAAKAAAAKREGTKPPPYIQFKYVLENGTAVLIENLSTSGSRSVKKTVADASLLSTVPEGPAELSPARAPLADVAIAQTGTSAEAVPNAEVRQRTSAAVAKAADSPPAYTASDALTGETKESIVGRAKADVSHTASALKTELAPLAKHPQAQEVPLHVTAILCLLSFLIGYML